MPSYAFRDFKRKTIDVYRLAQDYHTLLIIKGSKGRTALSHLTRSAVVLLAGAWESYIEDLMLESAVHLATLDNPHELPKDVKKTINSYIRSHKDESKPLTLAEDGWKKVYLNEIMKPMLDGFHSPKVININALGNSAIGLSELSKCLYSGDIKFIDDFIEYRGHIAHK